MKSYSDLRNEENGQDKCLSFIFLKDAIDKENINRVKEILTSKYGEVLGTWVIDYTADGRLGPCTFLTYAIVLGKIDVAQAILDIEDQNTLKTLLEEMSTLELPTCTYKLTALSLAKKKGYTNLTQKIKAKMDELEIPDKEDELIKSDESLGSFIDDGNKTFLSYLISNSLCLEVLYRDGEAVNSTLKTVRNLGSRLIGNKMAQQLAKKENKEILTEIQTAQAVRIAILGFAMVVLAVTPIAAIVFSS